METKICKQCGELKPIEQFRKYYGGRKGTYKTCKVCEKINARYKYLCNKGDSISFEEGTELDKIKMLYEVQRKAGLQPPREGNERMKPLVDSLDDMISKYKVTEVSLVAEAPDKHCVVAPAELQQWLTAELTEEPDYYLDEVYEELKAKYRPQLRIDTATMQPIYDDTYKDILDQILGRFNNYEDNYWED